MECKDLLNERLGNIFILEIDLPIKLPDTAGAYLICAKDIDILPVKMKELEYVRNKA